MADYNFIFKQSGTGTKKIDPSGKSSVPKPKASKEEEHAGGEAAQAFGQRMAEANIERFMISPLNSATGGLASPVYGLAKNIATGASAAAIGGAAAGLAMAAIQLAMTKIQERVAKLEQEANSANERDNALIRAGSKTFATFYEADFFRGVQKTNRG